MAGLPAYLTDILGKSPYLETICPDGGLDGELVKTIRNLSHAVLADGKKVASSSHLELVRGGLLYAVDALNAAHVIFQDDHSALGSYWHGMMHRREGDFSNACYWFRQAGAIPALRDLTDFDPVSFTMSYSKAKSERPEFLEYQKRRVGSADGALSPGKRWAGHPR